MDTIAAAFSEARTPSNVIEPYLMQQGFVMRTRWPPLSISDDDLRASIEQQRREIQAGTARLYSHEEVMAAMRTKLAKARDA